MKEGEADDLNGFCGEEAKTTPNHESGIVADIAPFTHYVHA
jgi:hypothetical protein